MLERILIIGATGNVGEETIKSLLKRKSDNQRIIAGVRNVDKAKKSLGLDQVEFRHFDFDDIASVSLSLAGIDKLFLVRPPAISDVKKYIFPVIAEAKKADIKQIVFLSLQGVEQNPYVPHYKVEKYILSSGLNYTFLRPSFFMQNLSTTHKDEIAKRNEIFIPAGRGRTNFIDVRDIGEVAALVLTEDGHLNKAYELTGSEALDYHQIAQILSKTLDRKIVYRNPSILSFFFRKKKEGLKTGYILVMTALYTVAKLGKAGGTTNTLSHLLHRDPITFEQFAEDYRAVW